MSRCRADRGQAGMAPAVALALVVVGASWLGAPGPLGAANARILAVPGAYPTIEAAIAASRRGDVIELGAGTYPGEVVVPEEKSGITIRGVDRNAVVFDGGDVRNDAIEVEADGVTLENLSAESYLGNGASRYGVEGAAGRFL